MPASSDPSIDRSIDLSPIVRRLNDGHSYLFDSATAIEDNGKPVADAD